MNFRLLFAVISFLTFSSSFAIARSNEPPLICSELTTIQISNIAKNLNPIQLRSMGNECERQALQLKTMAENEADRRQKSRLFTQAAVAFSASSNLMVASLK
jgi:hypothetical protein